MTQTYVPIPGPPSLPIVGNLPQIHGQEFLKYLSQCADTYGPIFRLDLPGKTLVVVANHAMVNEVCDDNRFHKEPDRVVSQLRNGVGDGLFTAKSSEPNWGIAHRILMPAFSPTAMRSMFDEMHGIASQLALKWARHGPTMPFEASEDFTRLTLDTIGLCAMGFRFNSFYHDELHPFIKAMTDFLVECGTRSRRPGFLPSVLYRGADKQYNDDIETLQRTADDVLKERKQNPNGKNDLMSAMLNSVDPKTGAKLDDANIRNNLITFLIAGHETTSGLLSFAFHELLANPDTYVKAQQEVDQVVGKGPIKVEHLSKLPYIAAVLRETLRLRPTVPVFARQPTHDEVLGGKYRLPQGQPVLMLLTKAHLDKTVYGENADEFVPERMLDDNFDRLNKEFPNCWKPFGSGMRACIGRPFAWQEALLVMAMMLQNFTVTMDDPSYKLKIKNTLTDKPENFKVRAALRDGLTPDGLEHRLAGTKPIPSVNGHTAALTPNQVGGEEGKPMTILYGSNTGTCKSLAQQMALNASARGFSATALDLDSGTNNLPTDRPVLIITASFEGLPPDNATKFFSWLQGLKQEELSGVSFAVFGCGNREWSQTFHRVPIIIDDALVMAGASRISFLGLTDVSQGEAFSDFETWEDVTFWPAMAEKYNLEHSGASKISSSISIEISSPRTSNLKQPVHEATVVAVAHLAAAGAPEKKHMEIGLPNNLSYSPGDYLAVLPMNPKESIYRVMRRFGLARDSYMTIATDRPTILPANTPVPVYDVLSSYVELSQVATKRNVLALSEATGDSEDKHVLNKLASEDYNAEISTKRISVLDLLDQIPSIDLPFGSFLSMLPPMTVRQYSISSSPRINSHSATITYSVLDDAHRSDPGRRHRGVASSYLASLSPREKIRVAVQPCHAGFHLPEDAENTPIICVAAGSGIAPFRGFIQHRASMIESGQKLAPAILFFGCRGPELDDLYRDEMDTWQALGAVDVRRAYSRVEAKQREAQEARGCRHVQDRLSLDRDDLLKVWDQGGKVFVCGSRGVAEGVKRIFIDVVGHSGENAKLPDEKAREQWFDGLRNVRYSVDCFD